MTTYRSHRRLTALGFLAIGCSTLASAQVVERDVSVTGPRGNTIERKVRTERVGNVIDRQIDIRRPGGTYHRETEIIGGIPGGRGPGPVYYGGPRFVGAPFVAAPAFSFFVGSAPPPPLYFGPPPVFVAAPPPRPIVIDAVTTEIENLSSLHSNHRRDGAIALGKYGDPRAVFPLVDRLKNDHEKEVRQAAAWALAEIGDSRAIIPLEAAAQFDKRPDVRAVAAKSLARMPSKLPRPHETANVAPAPRWHAAGETSATKPNTATRPAPSNNDDVPPPDPTPAPRSEPDPGFGYPRTSR